TTKEVVKQLQQAPASSDPYDWPIGAIIGAATGAALSAYQDVKGLAGDQMTIETLKSLGISI
ncbi:MAG: hypothetical protein ACU84Q_19265, partial [Gammaproteobacteria bacterium]